MRRRWIHALTASLALVLLAAAGCQSPETASEAPSGASPKAAPAAKERAEPLTLPSYEERVVGGADAEAELPMIVAIHGLGDRPENFFRLVEGYPNGARVILPRGYDSYGPGYSWFALTKAADGTIADAEGLAEATDGVAALIEKLAQERPTRGKPVVLGFSQGGILSWALARRHPELFSGIFPIAGTLPKAMHGAPSATPRVLAFHGADDRRIPHEPTLEMATSWREAGLNVELKTYPGVGHHTTAAMKRELFAGIADALGQRP